MRQGLVPGLLALVLLATPALAQNETKTFKHAFQGQLAGLDPYTLNETFTLGELGNVYDGLTQRGPDLKIEPDLATSWEVLSPTHWRFHLRKGVKFQNGDPFTAEDVVFSANRVRSEGSDLKTRIPADAKFEIVDPYTVDVILKTPDPTLPNEWDTWAIMDKKWTVAHDSVKVTSASDTTKNYASFHANGTGPFKIVSHEPGVKTVFEVNKGWWNYPNRKFNIDRVEFTPISSDATRVAALLSGQVDMIDPVPVQDIPRVEASPNAKAMTAPELRTIFLGMDQFRPELLYSNVKGKNPFKDVRVRRAFCEAIDVQAIKTKIMRGLSQPAALMISPLLFARADEFKHCPYDPVESKKLLADAGYPKGFEVQLDCPNDRYVNDAAICQAVTAMLARVGVKIDLNAQPKSKYFAKVLQSGGYNTSFYLLGWTPSGFDSYNVLADLMNCRDAKGNGSPFNLGGYCNPKVDALTKQILVESNPKKRNDLIAQAFRITTDDVAYIPLHQQDLAWGVSKKVDLVQRADDVLMYYHINMK